MAGESSRSLDPVILTGSTHPDLARNVGNLLNYDVYPANREPFKDTELNIKIPTNVAGRRVYIIQPTCRMLSPDGNTPIPGSVNTSIVELALMVNAANHSDAAEITIITPHYAGQRGDKKDEPRTPLPGKLYTDFYQVAGVDRIVTMDLHNPALENAINGKNTWKNVFGSWVLVPAIKELGLPYIRVASPDAGGVKRGEKFEDMLGSEMMVRRGVVHPDKQRNHQIKDQSTTSRLNLDLRGENLVVVDDVLSSGGTLADGAKVFKEAGAGKVYAAVTHALWTDDALAKIKDSAIDTLFITDSVPQPRRVLEDRSGRIKIFSVAPIIAGIIECLETGDSISARYILTHKQEEPVEPAYTADLSRPSKIGHRRLLNPLEEQLLAVR